MASILYSFTVHGIRSRLCVPLLLLFFATPGQAEDPAENRTRLRVVTANLTSGRLQSYDQGHGSRILQGLKADIALIQEMNAGTKTDSEAKAWARSVFSSIFHVFREVGELPNGIVSRWPMLAAGEWDDPEVPNRDFAWARVDVPGERDLWLFSVHLLHSSERKRIAEAKVLVDLIQQNIPAADYVVLGGDLNTRHRNEECVKVLGAQFVVEGPFPADEAGNESTNAKRSSPYDWVLADKDLEQHKVPVKIGDRTFPNGLVFDTRVFGGMNLVSPAQPSDSAAEQMQHMAVVRDFAIPVSR